MKTAVVVVAALALVLGVAACGGEQAPPADTSQASATQLDDLSSSTDASLAADASGIITLNGGVITVDGEGATVDGSRVTVTSAGTYVVKGSLDDGQIVVNTKDEGIVRLVLSGVDISCSTSSAIYAQRADRTVITLADGTVNAVADGDSYIFEDQESDEPNATIFSKDDLTIEGDGSLNVSANYKNGIVSKADLKIIAGDITVDAANDAIRACDSVTVEDGIIAVNAGSDGIQATNDEEPDKGSVTIESGVLDITATADGIQAETDLLISGGDIAVSSGGGSVNGADQGGEDMPGNWDQDQPGATSAAGIESTSAANTANLASAAVDTDAAASDTSTSAGKGLKAGGDITISGGTLSVDSADDAIHSADGVQISAGTLKLASADDAVHADASVEINGGEMVVSTSYEGIESVTITVNGGDVRITSSDDGINGVSSTADSSTTMPAGRGGFDQAGDSRLVINGGYMTVDAGGDGLDVNGSIEMTDGTVIINGPTNDGNGAIDYGLDFVISGGYFLAVGSSGMAEAPSASSTQYSVMINLAMAQDAGTLVHLQSEEGEDILTFAPGKQYQSVVLCSPDLENGETYSVYLGGSSSGSAVDGVYSGGIYSGGVESSSFTVSSIVTTSGAAGGGMRGSLQGGAQDHPVRGGMPGDRMGM